MSQLNVSTCSNYFQYLFSVLTHFFANRIIKLDTEHFCYQNILSAHHWRLINDWIENIVRLPEASNKCPAWKLFRNNFCFWYCVFITHCIYYKYTKARKRGGVRMATSSITHNFVVSNPNSVKRFVAAIDEADRDRSPKQTLPGRQLTNPQEILALMSKRKKQHVW